MTFEELLNQLAEDYLNPPSFPDGKKDADRNGHTRLAELQTRYSLSSLKIQKLLVTAGVFEPVKTSSAFYTVKRLFDAGRSVDEIRSATGLSKAAVNAFLPYERGAKELDKLGVDISGDAARKRKQRSAEEMKKENARNILAENMSDEALWNALDEHYRETFITSSGQRFGINLSITEDGDGDKPELTVSVLNRGMIHIPQAEVFNAYHKALEEKALNGDGEDTGKYDEYLRPVFVYLGVLDGDRSEVTTKRDVRESDVCSCYRGVLHIATTSLTASSRLPLLSYIRQPLAFSPAAIFLLSVIPTPAIKLFAMLTQVKNLVCIEISICFFTVTLCFIQGKAEIVNQTAIARAEADKQVAVKKAEAEAETLRIAAEAEAEKVRIAAEAEAEANRKLSENLTDELIELKKVEAWDGRLPSVYGGNALLELGIDTAE